MHTLIQSFINNASVLLREFLCLEPPKEYMSSGQYVSMIYDDAHSWNKGKPSIEKSIAKDSIKKMTYSERKQFKLLQK